MVEIHVPKFFKHIRIISISNIHLVRKGNKSTICHSSSLFTYKVSVENIFLKGIKRASRPFAKFLKYPNAIDYFLLK